ncbi:hemicentin-1-like isoform X2 [Acanthaster planci]|uniref:Hemicentin-1-like isoform X2 n=1 Tax=Acanthaster planci TaxID=133434 RepID=A0A8B7XL60_ACAPL|nr:hemicentin-1-like isoform X2 [Acanthaster planci]
MIRFVAVVFFGLVCVKLAHTAQDGYCFRFRNPAGSWGRCQQLIERAPDGTPVNTQEECCLLGADGWSEKSSGKRCGAACPEPGEDQPDPGAGAAENRPPQAFQEEAKDQNVVEGVWGTWSDWQPCSVTCGSGFSERRRDCRRPRDHPDDNFQCSGDRVEHRDCNAGVKCPVHGQWSEWSPWSECSATCGDTLSRFRGCNSPAPRFGGNQCVGEGREVRWCNDRRNCPIHGGWRQWSAWSPCSVSCGRDGLRRRLRMCTNPAPRYGGRDCVGDQTSTRPCLARKRNCPIDGGLSEWGTWICPQECANNGRGSAVRRRSCNNPTPKYGGKQCKEKHIETVACSMAICPVDGMWGSWSRWGGCSSTCGESAFKSRRRDCDNPPPENGGLKCEGKGHEIKLCNLDPCPGDASEWGDSAV